jgi:hypothetical protein
VNEDKCTGCKCKVADSILVLALKLLCQRETTLDDMVVDKGKVILALLKLSGTHCDKVVSGEWLDKVSDEECG